MSPQALISNCLTDKSVAFPLSVSFPDKAVIHSVNKHLMSTHCVSVTILDGEDIPLNKKKISTFQGRDRSRDSFKVSVTMLSAANTGTTNPNSKHEFTSVEVLLPHTTRSSR